MVLVPQPNIVLGRGMVFFDRFLAGTMVGEGERYIGNTTAFSIRRDVQKIERLRSVRGHIVKRDELSTREMLRGDFITDDMRRENVAEWFGGSEIETGQDPIGEVVETFPVKRGRYYQLGTSHFPVGVRNVEYPTFRVGGTVIDIAPNLILDKAEGRFGVLDDAANLDDDTVIEVTFQWRSSPTTSSFGTTPTPIEGSLRFLATNPVGKKKNFFFPRVSISSNGEMALKGDEWQQLAFVFESIPLNPQTQQLYVVEGGLGLFTEDEQAILDGGVTLEAFPYWEDQLNEIINVTMPGRGY